MADFPLGVAVIILCAAGLFFSWRYWARENYKAAIFLLLFCGFLLRIYASSDSALHDWDERYHALVSKNLIQHPLTPVLYKDPVLPYDYKDWSANHIWLHKQPLPLWTMAASMWLFGVNEIALRFPSIILTTIGIWLTFSIGSSLFNKKTGYLAALFYTINGRIIEQTAGRVATDHIDVFFLFFIELAVFFVIAFVQKKKTIFNVLAGVAIGLAILSKWLPALIVLPVWLLLIIDSGKFKRKEIVLQAIVLLVSCTLVFLPWQLYIYNAFPVEANWEASYNFKHITETLLAQGSVFSYVQWIAINYGDLIYLPLFWFAWKIFKSPGNLKRIATFIWFLVPFLFFSFAKTRMMGYLLFTAPALFIITSEFWLMLSAYRTNNKFKWVFNIILILLVALPLRYTSERLKPLEDNTRKPGWKIALEKLDDKKIAKGVLLNYDRPIEAMFYTDLVAYPSLPDKKTLTGLIGKGYKVIINDKDGNVPDSIKAIEGVIIENLGSIDK